MKAYYVIGEVDQVAKRSTTNISVDKKELERTDKHFFFDGIEHLINDKVFLVVPLTEICRVFELRLNDFLTDEMMDMMNKLAQKQGHPVIVNI